MRHENEREETSATTKLTFLLIGGGIGAVIALLFAPKSGVELREDIADVTRKGLEKGKETAAEDDDDDDDVDVDVDNEDERIRTCARECARKKAGSV